MPTKPKNQRTFEQTRKYNEYMRKYNARRRAGAKKEQAGERISEQAVSPEVLAVLSKAIESKDKP